MDIISKKEANEKVMEHLLFIIEKAKDETIPNFLNTKIASALENRAFPKFSIEDKDVEVLVGVHYSREKSYDTFCFLKEQFKIAIIYLCEKAGYKVKVRKNIEDGNDFLEVS